MKKTPPTKSPRPKANPGVLTARQKMELHTINSDAFKPKPKKPSLASRVAKAITTPAPGVAEKSKKYVEGKLRARGDKTRR